MENKKKNAKYLFWKKWGEKQNIIPKKDDNHTQNKGWERISGFLPA